MSQAGLIKRWLDGRSVAGTVNVKAQVEVHVWLACLCVLSFGRTRRNQKPLKRFSNNMVKCLLCQFSRVLQ